MVELKRGNAYDIEFLVKDKDGNPVQDLADTQEIIFMLKRDISDPDEEAVVEKRKTLGHIEVNQPDIGYLRVRLLADDTDQEPGLYYVGLQLDYGNGKVYEVDLFKDGQIIETFKIKPDVIRG